MYTLALTTYSQRMTPSFSPSWKFSPIGMPVTSSIQIRSSSSFCRSYFWAIWERKSTIYWNLCMGVVFIVTNCTRTKQIVIFFSWGLHNFFPLSLIWKYYAINSILIEANLLYFSHVQQRQNVLLLNKTFFASYIWCVYLLPSKTTVWTSSKCGDSLFCQRLYKRNKPLWQVLLLENRSKSGWRW